MCSVWVSMMLRQARRSPPGSAMPVGLRAGRAGLCRAQRGGTTTDGLPEEKPLSPALHGCPSRVPARVLHTRVPGCPSRWQPSSGPAAESDGPAGSPRPLCCRLLYTGKTPSGVHHSSVKDLVLVRAVCTPAASFTWEGEQNHRITE